MTMETGGGSGPRQGAASRFIKLWGARGLLHYGYRQPIYRIQVLALLAVALIPVAIIAVHLYYSAWENAWREIEEKHQLLAMNLASPIRIYIQDHKEMLTELAGTMLVVSQRRRSEDKSSDS